MEFRTGMKLTGLDFRRALDSLAAAVRRGQATIATLTARVAALEMRPEGKWLVPVAVTLDGGANGTSTAPPSYTYTVTYLHDSTPLATNVSPMMQRPIGAANPAAKGIAMIRRVDSSASDIYLVWCDETPQVATCP